jgi:hypothetical protein
MSEDLGGGEVRTGVVQGVQDGQTLGRHAIAVRSQLVRILISAGHALPYCKKLQ